jgi:pectinesterase
MEIPLAQRLAAQGFVAATVEYRLSPEAKYPAAMHDLRTAIRWLRAHAERYGIDTSRIAACGGSAGGNLAVSLGVGTGKRAGVEGSEWGGFSDRIQAVVDIDGPLDLTIREERVKGDDPSKPSAAARWLGFSFEERPDLWREVSPVFHVTAECPPILFINSSIERFHAGRDRMIEEMDRFGIPSEVHSFPETPHPFWLFHPWAEETSVLAARFLRRVFGTADAKLDIGRPNPY